MPLKNVVVLAICAIISLTCYFASARNRFANLFAEVVELVDREHLAAPDSRKLFESAINGLLGDLDEHSVFLSGDVFTTFSQNIEQVFGGVGMYVEVDPATTFLMVTVPMPETPAFRAGLMPRDLITAIDGTSTLGKTRSECIQIMRGPVGEPVRLEIRRAGETSQVSLTRAVIPVTSVFGDTTEPDGTRNFFLADYPRLGYLRIDQFGERTTEEARKAIRSIAGKIDGLILDLRNNGGGPLDSAVAISDMFLESGLTIVETRGRGRKLKEPFLSRAGVEIGPEIPIAVLVNRNTASASEIVAACLQDHGRAIVAGERTYGKGTVQNVFPLEPGRSSLKLTVASYWPPGGRCIDRNDPSVLGTEAWGVQPNPGFAIELTEEEIAELYIQRQTREIAGLIGTGSAGDRPAAKQGTSTGNQETDSDLPETGIQSAPLADRALLRAIQWLNQQPPAARQSKGPIAAVTS
jgi:carboxyl-terminal processing protease